MLCVEFFFFFYDFASEVKKENLNLLKPLLQTIILARSKGLRCPIPTLVPPCTLSPPVTESHFSPCSPVGGPFSSSDTPPQRWLSTAKLTLQSRKTSYFSCLPSEGRYVWSYARSQIEQTEDFHPSEVMFAVIIGAVLKADRYF